MHWLELLYVGGEESGGPLGRVDDRLKIVFLTVAVVLILLSDSVAVPLYFLGFSALLMLVSGVSRSQFLMRLVAPFLVVGTLILVQLFFYGTTPLLEIPVPFGTWTMYQEGLTRGIQLATRVAGGVSLIILLSLTSSVLEILAALKWFRVPEVWLETAFLSYRYLFVFLRHLITGYQSQQVRLGYVGWGRGFRSLGQLIGNLFLHVMDQSQRTYNAMRMRGYRDRIPLPKREAEIELWMVFVAAVCLAPGVILLWL